eukprot:TRINITY_DN1037_c0_g1_i3.p1 TRINITY_DN1037_c0_g1~~TRINITY_DN1037_c0_g1_i3.p1  ORF type:complete len:482 (-),score=66.14 TRINITY_DN1037_c0_g1_i3:5380-6825(-)
MTDPCADSHIQAPEQCELYLLIHHPFNHQILTYPDNVPTRLPCLKRSKCPGSFYFKNTEKWIPEVRAYFNYCFEMTLLRCIWHKEYNEELQDDLFRTMIVLESHGKVSNLPAQTEWREVDSVEIPIYWGEEAQEAIRRFNEESSTDEQPKFRPLFFRRGWYSDTVKWMKQAVADEKLGEVVKVTQLKHTYRGCVLRGELKSGRFVYLKCSSYITNEAAVIAALLKVVPQCVTKPIVMDVEKRVVLMEDYGEVLWSAALRGEEGEKWTDELADIHQSTVGSLSVLIAAGLRTVSIDVIIREYDDMVDFAERAHLVDGKEAKDLKRFGTEVKADLKAVGELGIPLTFVHGDLCGPNIYKYDNPEISHKMIDFADAHISHPFVDAVVCCPDPVLYCVRWHQYLNTNSPLKDGKVREYRRDEYFRACVRFTDSSFVFDEMRLYKEVCAVESPLPPEMQTDLRGLLLGTIRRYGKIRPARRERLGS